MRTIAFGSSWSGGALADGCLGARPIVGGGLGAMGAEGALFNFS